LRSFPGFSAGGGRGPPNGQEKRQTADVDRTDPSENELPPERTSEIGYNGSLRSIMGATLIEGAARRPARDEIR